MADRQLDRRLRGAGLTHVAVIGGGIVGCAAAAFLAEAGADVALYERGELAGAASGRNSGAVQHPFDSVLTDLHERTLALYGELGLGEVSFRLPDEPVGVLTLAPEGDGAADEEAVGDGAATIAALVERIATELPELAPTLVQGPELPALEPLLAPGLVGCRIETGYPVRPAAATLAYARLARRRGAALHEHAPARPWVEGGRVRGVIVGAEGPDVERRPADAVLVAAGPWSPALVEAADGASPAAPSVAGRSVAGASAARPPIAPVWGVVAELALDSPPRHVLEEVGVEGVGVGPATDAVFSLVAGEGASALGSTFEVDEPRPEAWIERLRSHGRRFVPAVAQAPVVGTRACARPLAADGRPLIGQVAEGLWVAAGNGAWGISTGPATAEVAVASLLDGAAVPAPLSASRFA